MKKGQFSKESFFKRIYLVSTSYLYQNLLKPVSKFFVRLFKKQRIQKAIGLQVVLSTFIVGVFPSFLSIAQTETLRFAKPSCISCVIAGEEIQITTQKSLKLPLENFVYTQGYSFFHPAIDLAAPLGTKIYPIADGKIIYVNKSRFGFGNQIVIDHGNQFKSLYAHLAKIEVNEGDFVTKDTEIGTVGSTGRSTGPHLHLQIWENGKLINPKTLFESYFGKKISIY